MATEDDRNLPRWRNLILNRFQKRRSRDLHFRELNHDQRVVVAQEMARLPLKAVLVSTHKPGLESHACKEHLSAKGQLYKYLIHHILVAVPEICCAASNGEDCSVRFVFSRRGKIDQATMLQWLRALRDDQPPPAKSRRIRWELIDLEATLVEDHKKWAGLQFSDCITSAFFKALDPNAYGNREPTYARELRVCLPRGDGRLFSRALQFMPPRHISWSERAQLGIVRKSKPSPL